MYRPPHLTKAQYDELVEALRESHSYGVAAQLRDLDGHPVKDLSDLVDKDNGGQVDMKGRSRSATVTLNDPARTLHAYEGSAALHYILAVSYVVRDLSWGRESVPVITGRLDTMGRTGPQVTATLRGKGAMFDHAMGHPLTVKKGTRKTDAIKQIMVAGGERVSLMSIGDRPARLGKDLVLPATGNIWGHARALADSLDMLLFYDADGRLQGRAIPDSAAVTMRTGFHNRLAWLTSEPTKTTNGFKLVNRVIYHYRDKKTDPVVVELPERHPLSAQSLARDGVPQWYVDVHTDYAVNVKAHAASLAEQRLKRAIASVVAVQAESYPFPFLEPADVVRFESRDYSGSTTVPSWTLPLTPGQTMTLGWSDVRSNW